MRRFLLIGAARRRAGFTVLEVIIALMVFSMGAGAVITAVWRARHIAQQSAEEIIISFIEKEIRARNQIKAYAAGRMFAGDPDPAQSWPQWGVYNREQYDNMIASGTALPTWDQNLLISGFDFFVEDITGQTGDDVSGAPGIRTAAQARVKEDWQYVDFDGYGVVDEREIGRKVEKTDPNNLKANVPLDPNGKIEPGYTSVGGKTITNKDSPGTGLKYDSTKMRHYQKVLRLTIGWDFRQVRPADPTYGNAQAMRDYLTSGKYSEMVFTIFNPDTVKR
jgi:prepilin-type N-terminal cleavage/methylation domain-containing protein